MRQEHSRMSPFGHVAAPSRRSFLTGSAAAALAPFLHDLSRAATAPTLKAKAKSVILIFNCGAPSHHDLFDPKPDADVDVRGPFSTIATSVPGVRVTELLPQIARRMDKLALIRSVHHEHSSH